MQVQDYCKVSLGSCAGSVLGSQLALWLQVAAINSQVLLSHLLSLKRKVLQTDLIFLPCEGEKQVPQLSSFFMSVASIFVIK